MSDKTKSMRRNYFIDKEFQGRYIFTYFLLVTIGSVLFMGVFSFFSSNTLSIVYDNYHLQLGLTPEILFKNILSTQWLFLFVGGGGVVIVTLFLTHRVAGPFFRFEKKLVQMKSGDVSKDIVLREKDEGKKLAQNINEFNEMLSNNLSSVMEFNSKIPIAVHQMRKEIEGSDIDPSRTEPYFDQILDCQKKIQKVVDYYTFVRQKL